MKKTIVFLMCLFGLCLGCFSQAPTVVTNYVVVTNVVYVQPQMNMDSYGYFQQYYLVPRTLGYSYRLMYPAPVYYRPPTISFGFEFRHGGHPSPYQGGHYSGHRR